MRESPSHGFVDDGLECSQGDLVVPSPSKDPQIIVTPSPRQMAMIQPDTSVPAETTETTDARPVQPTISKLTLMDQQLMMPPPKLLEMPAQHLETSPRPRPFRRVLSENDSPARGETRAVNAATTKIPIALQGLKPRERNLEKYAEGRLPFKSPTKLQRSKSDTAVVIPAQKAVAVNVPEVIEAADVEGDVGPWSTKEAFLLFDWWPPGRERPTYGERVGAGGHLPTLRDEVDI